MVCKSYDFINGWYKVGVYRSTVHIALNEPVSSLVSAFHETSNWGPINNNNSNNNNNPSRTRAHEIHIPCLCPKLLCESGSIVTLSASRSECGVSPGFDAFNMLSNSWQCCSMVLNWSFSSARSTEAGGSAESSRFDGRVGCLSANGCSVILNYNQNIYVLFITKVQYSRAGSWSLRALRLESDCGPLVHIFAILTLF